MELDAFLQGLPAGATSRNESMIGRLDVTRLPELGLTVAIGGLGKSQFAIHTQHLIDLGEKWDVVVCAGVAGSLTDDLAVGDVVIGTETVEHDLKKLVTQENPRFPGSEAHIEAMRKTALPDAGFSVHFAPVASGDQTVRTSEMRSSLHESTGAVAVAWEGAGGARACEFSGVPYVEIRSITDHADSQVTANIIANMPVCMKNIATVIAAWAASDR